MFCIKRKARNYVTVEKEGGRVFAQIMIDKAGGVSVISNDGTSAQVYRKNDVIEEIKKARKRIHGSAIW